MIFPICVLKVLLRLGERALDVYFRYHTINCHSAHLPDLRNNIPIEDVICKRLLQVMYR